MNTDMHGTDPRSRREASIKELLEVLEFRVEQSYEDFRRKHNANQSSK